MSEKVRPFSNGTEYDFWENRNCDQCILSIKFKNTTRFLCHIESAIVEAYFNYGEIEKKIADKVGFDDRHFFKDCPFKNAYKIQPAKLNLTVFKHQQLSLF